MSSNYKTLFLFLLPSISLLMSALFFSPWILTASGSDIFFFQIVAMLWFLFAWVIAIAYGVGAYLNREKNPALKTRALIGATMIAASYFVVLIGIWIGYGFVAPT